MSDMLSAEDGMLTSERRDETHEVSELDLCIRMAVEGESTSGTGLRLHTSLSAGGTHRTCMAHDVRWTGYIPDRPGVVQWSYARETRFRYSIMTCSRLRTQGRMQIRVKWGG